MVKSTLNIPRSHTKVQTALEEEAEGPSAELRRGAWAMAQRIIERFELGPKGSELH
jgi:hypothetical protein